MPTTSKPAKNTVPVGQTPVSRYASWDDHREAMRLDSEARQTELKRRQVEMVIERRTLV